eukprot:COSAG04_NODE_3231_length_3022_cov_1.858023_1_plen_65_part_00
MPSTAVKLRESATPIAVKTQQCLTTLLDVLHYMLSYLAEHHILLELPSNVMELAPSTIMQLPSV